MSERTGGGPFARPQRVMDDQSDESCAAVSSSTRPHSSAVDASITVPEQSERGGPLTPDPTGEARRAAGTGNQAERHLRQRDPCVRIGDDPAGEGGHLDPAAERRTVDAHLDPVTEPFDQRQPGYAPAG